MAKKPWKRKDWHSGGILDAEGRIVAGAYGPEIAREIVIAVNCHDDLVKALELAQAGLAEAMQPHLVPGLQATYEIVKDALSKAEGKGM